MNPKAMQPAPMDASTTPAWAAYYQAIYAASQPLVGTTAQRPAAPLVGMDFFDTTLGYKITCKQATPSVVWVNGAGTTV